MPTVARISPLTLPLVAAPFLIFAAEAVSPDSWVTGITNLGGFGMLAWALFVLLREQQAAYQRHIAADQQRTDAILNVLREENERDRKSCQEEHRQIMTSLERQNDNFVSLMSEFRRLLEDR